GSAALVGGTVGIGVAPVAIGRSCGAYIQPGTTLSAGCTQAHAPLACPSNTTCAPSATDIIRSLFTLGATYSAASGATTSASPRPLSVLISGRLVGTAGAAGAAGANGAAGAIGAALTVRAVGAGVGGRRVWLAIRASSSRASSLSASTTA